MIGALVYGLVLLGWAIWWWLRVTRLVWRDWPRWPMRVAGSDAKRGTWLGAEACVLAVLLQAPGLFYLALFGTLIVGIVALDYEQQEANEARDRPPPEGGW